MELDIGVLRDNSTHFISCGKVKGLRATPMGVVKNGGAKCYFATLNSVLAPLNIVFAPMVGAKLGCHFNNLMFFIKKYN